MTVSIYSFHEWAKLRVSRAFVPHVLMCLTCLRAFVYFHCKRLHFFNVPYTTSFSYVPYLPSFFTCLACIFFFFFFLRAFIFLRVLIVLTCITCPNFFTCLMCLHRFTCLHFECVKFPGSRAIVGLVPLCHRAFKGILWVQDFFSWLFPGF